MSIIGVQIIVSTMNKKKINELDLENYKEAGFDTITIINQTSEKLDIQKESNATMYSYNEKGLSKSRNRGLNLVKENIFLLTDDDVKYIKNISKVIEKNHMKYLNNTILTFKIMDIQENEFNNYPKKYKEHTFRSLLKVSSIEITFKKTNKEIKYDENFGLGAKFSTGEENIFLFECLKNKYKIGFVPEVIGYHPLESSGSILNRKNLEDKKEVYKKLFGKNLYKIFGIIFILKKVKKLKEMGLIEAIKIFIN